MLAFLVEDRGVTAIEYSLIGSIVVVGAILALDRMGESLKTEIYDLVQGISAYV